MDLELMMEVTSTQVMLLWKNIILVDLLLQHHHSTHFKGHQQSLPDNYITFYLLFPPPHHQSRYENSPLCLLYFFNQPSWPENNLTLVFLPVQMAVVSGLWERGLLVTAQPLDACYDD